MPDDGPPRLTLEGAARFTALSLVIALGVYVLVVGLAKVLVVVLPFVIALFLTAILQPLVNRLQARGLHRMLATWLVLLGSLGLFVGLGLALAPSVRDQFGDLGPTLTESRQQIEDWLQDGPLELSAGEIDRYYQQGVDALGERSSDLTTRAAEAATIVAETIAGFFLVLVLTFFLVKDGPKMVAFGARQVPPRHADLADGVAARAWRVVGSFIRGTATIGLIEAVSTGIAFWIIGVPLVLPLALLFFLGAFFPLVGAVVAGIIATLVALVGGGFVKALIVVAIVLFVQQVESDVLAPLVLAKAVFLHPVVILVVLTAGAVVGGLVGAFLAVPLTAVLVAVGTELKARGVIGPTAPPPAA